SGSAPSGPAAVAALVGAGPDRGGGESADRGGALRAERGAHGAAPRLPHTAVGDAEGRGRVGRRATGRPLRCYRARGLAAEQGVLLPPPVPPGGTRAGLGAAGVPAVRRTLRLWPAQ